MENNLFSYNKNNHLSQLGLLRRKIVEYKLSSKTYDIIFNENRLYILEIKGNFTLKDKEGNLTRQLSQYYYLKKK